MLTPQQLELRRKYIGSSDTPAICGRDRRHNAADIYLSKISELDDGKPAEWMKRGNRLEDPVLDWFEEETGLQLERNVFAVGPDGIHAANYDALVVGKKQGVEAKTCNVEYIDHDLAAEWGEEGTDEIPTEYLLQTQEQMYVKDLELVWVPVLIGGRGWCMFKVERNEKLIRGIVQIGERFWNEHVLKRVPPPNVAPSLDFAKRIKRQRKRIELMSEEDRIAAETYLKEKAAYDAQKKRKDDAQAIFLTRMGTADEAMTPAGLFTYYAHKEERTDVKRLKLEKPEIAREYVKTSYPRRLLHKDSKSRSSQEE